MRYKTVHLSILTVLTIIVFACFGCSDKAVNQRPVTGALMAVDLSDMASLSQGVLDQFRIAVSREVEPTSTLIDTLVTIPGDSFVVLLDSLPANEPLVFISQVVMSASGTTIYEGQTTAILVPDGITNVDISLSPVVPMLRFAPRYLQTSNRESFEVDLRVINVEALFGVTVRIGVDTALLQYDSARAGLGIDPATEFFAIYDSTTPVADTLALGLTHTVPGASLTDAGGDATIATISFTTMADPVQTPTFNLEVVLTGMIGSDSISIPLSGIYTVDGVIDVVLAQ